MEERKAANRWMQKDAHEAKLPEGRGSSGCTENHAMSPWEKEYWELVG